MTKATTVHLPQHVTTRELAAMLRVSPDTVRMMEKDGRLPRAIRLGPQLFRWDRREIEEWLAAGCPRMEPAGV